MITSPHNETIKLLKRLQERKHRDSCGLFLVEGFRELSRAIEKYVGVQELFYANSLLNPEASLWLHRVQSSFRTTELSAEVFEKVSYREHPDGLMAIAKIEKRNLQSLVLSESPLIVVAEGIEKPGNLGALMRTAEASGAEALIASDCLCDIYNPNCIRASQGALFSLPIFECSNATTLHFLQQHSLSIIATTPHTPTLYYAVDMTQPTAILVGNEHNGLSDFWLQTPFTQHVKIPMSALSDSLNANIAAAIVLFEAVRQRQIV
jgi:RNA methyltransferase, TrmH family